MDYTYEIGAGWFPQNDLVRAIHYAHAHGLFERLNQMYESIPAGECGGCADCCMESVETHWIEFLQIFDYLQGRPEILEQVLPGILRFYLLEGAEKRHCPFQLEGRRCGIYPVRPLPCRFFGQWGEEDYHANFAVTLRGNRLTAEYYQTNYGMVLPESVINHKVPYCQTFHKPHDLTQDDFYDLLDMIMVLQSRFLLEGLVDEDITSFGLVTWLMGVWFDLDKMQDFKVAVMRELLDNGREQLLQRFIADVQGKCKLV